MRMIGKLVLAGAIGGLAGGCSGDSTGTSLPELVGTWHATTAVVTSVANPATSANLIALGASLQIVFRADLSYTTTTSLPGNGAEVSTGSYVETATQLVLHGDPGSGGEVTSFSLSLSGGSLLLTGGALNFDFGGGEVPAKLDLTLVH